jgi:cytochrome c553
MKIVLSALLALLIIGCSDEKKEIQKEVKQELKPTSIVKIDKKIVEKKVAIKVPVQIQKKSILKPIDGAKIFAKCSSCHGKGAEKKALNKSQIIKGWSQEKIITAINGYKDGTYGSSMKGVMKPQVIKLTKEEINAVSAYISKL